MRVAGEIEDLPDFDRPGSRVLCCGSEVRQAPCRQPLVIETTLRKGSNRLDQAAMFVEIFIQSQHTVYWPLVRYRTSCRRVTVPEIQQPRLIPAKEITLQLRIQVGE